jgi:hypothetical protein
MAHLSPLLPPMANHLSSPPLSYSSSSQPPSYASPHKSSPSPSQHLHKLLQRRRNPTISPIRLEQHFPRRLVGAQVHDGARDDDLVAAGVPRLLGVAACVAAHPEVEAVGGGMGRGVEGGDVF